jgi:hypothetical protein
MGRNQRFRAIIIVCGRNERKAAVCVCVFRNSEWRLVKADLDKLRLELQRDLDRMRSAIERWMFAQTLLLLGVITTLHFVR